ncbi:MAG: septation protein SepH [Candidatus Nanopelagicales bacterium]|jgi:hypothetical protein|nr:septation protein SepH [Candidatus Nanopelagicales bacterium]MCU0295276.1 septation protein SepH [Candidatus Nanopelagicales bacterium]
MRELQFDRLSDDGTHFVLLDSRGVRYSLPIDEELAASARRGLQRNSVRNEAGTTTPRDIQALIRQGMTIDEVTQTTGLAADFVQRFAEPVVAEMDFVIQRARRLSIYAAGQQVRVDDLVDRAAAQADVPTEELVWSCRKTEDATWRIDASTGDRDLVSLVFRVSEGTITPADGATAELLRGRRVVDLTDSEDSGRIPEHWDALHPAAKAAAAARVPRAPESAPDDPSRIF